VDKRYDCRETVAKDTRGEKYKSFSKPAPVVLSIRGEQKHEHLEMDRENSSVVKQDTNTAQATLEEDGHDCFDPVPPVHSATRIDEHVNCMIDSGVSTAICNDPGIFSGLRSNIASKLTGGNVDIAGTVTTENTAQASSWHQRLGHVNFPAFLQLAASKAIPGLNTSQSENTWCDACVEYCQPVGANNPTPAAVGASRYRLPTAWTHWSRPWKPRSSRPWTRPWTHWSRPCRPRSSRPWTRPWAHWSSPTEVFSQSEYSVPSNPIQRHVRVAPVPGRDDALTDRQQVLPSMIVFGIYIDPIDVTMMLHRTDAEWENEIAESRKTSESMDRFRSHWY